ncbi:50S ribosomal protein L32e [Candidatus Woesearchaeota archaeon CG10_big_fil_rev_8_21_14_0_10_37_12]|nr:MAG: 50S ribosomal protein L32e [Candidatus Woesearchaeota archaeon CG10_big_fil_rev_8_21_14_0_10_37_12]
MSKELLTLRKKIDNKRPSFKRYCHNKRKRVGTKWIKPKGMHNKVRLGFWGKPPMVSKGYRGPAAVRTVDQSGLLPVLVHNMAALSQIKPKEQGVIIAKIGNKKRLAILTACQEKKITVLNAKTIDNKIKKITDKQSAKKQTKQKQAELRQEKTKEKQKKKPEEEQTNDQEQEKKEIQKVLTKRE